MPYVKHFKLGDTVVDIPQTESDMFVSIKPEEWGNAEINTADQMVEGMTTDGTFLYLASIDKSDGMSNPVITRVNISDKTITRKYPTKKGHYNSLDYFDGTIYATGFNPSDTYDVYTQIYAYDFASNTGNAITTHESYWNFCLGRNQYDTAFFLGFKDSIPAWVLWSEVVPDSNKFYPFTLCDINWINGVEQGACIWNNDYVILAVADRKSFGQTKYSNNEIHIYTLTGQLVRIIDLDMPLYELQDVCVVGNRLYICVSNGKIYTIPDITKFFMTYYEGSTRPGLWKHPCYLYINENGTETNINGNNGGYLLKSFKLNTFTMWHHWGDAGGYLNLRSYLFPFRLNPVTGDITVSAILNHGGKNWNLRFYYARGEDSRYYFYNLSSIVGGYTDLETGVYTAIDARSDAAFQSLVNMLLSDGYCYIHNITADSAAPYTFNPLSV